MKKIIYGNCYHYNRNYGCRLKEVIYKGYRTLILENEKIRISILIDKGSDIIEFLYKPEDIDFMWQSPLGLKDKKSNIYTKNRNEGSFLDEYEGGWQELLPSMVASHNYKNSEIGIMGEIFSIPWNYSVLIDDIEKIKIKLFTRMVRTPFYIEKFITLKSNQSFIEIEEEIFNEAEEEFKFMWGHHPAIGIPFLSENCFIDLPDGLIGKTYHMDLSDKNILPLNVNFNWPFILDKKGQEIDLSKIMSPDVITDFRFSIEGFKNGWYGITNPMLGVGFGFKWDINVFKYLWIWCSYKGFFNFPFYGRAYTIALEPWSSIPDNFDDVLKLGSELTLGPRRSLKTKYQVIVFKANKRIRGFNNKSEPIF